MKRLQDFNQVSDYSRRQISREKEFFQHVILFYVQQ